jgi:hypothetical protein
MGQARLILLCCAAVACGSPETPKAPPAVVEEFPAPREPPSSLPLAPVPPILLRGVGFQSPESAVFDAVADVYLISNVSGGPADADNDGFISKVSPDGSLLELKWIDAATSKTTLNAPKGMALVGDTLFVADIDVVRAFDRSSGKALGDVAIPSATFLNDVAAVYVIDAQRSVKTLAQGPELGQPNGLVAEKSGVLVATVTGELYRLDREGKKALLGQPGLGLDGMVQTPGGRLIVSSWESSSVLLSKAPPAPPGELEPFITELTSPADLGYDTRRRQLIVPLFKENALYIQELPGDVN